MFGASSGGVQAIMGRLWKKVPRWAAVCAVICMSTVPLDAREHGVTLRHGNAVNTFIPPVITAHFVDGEPLKIRENITAVHVPPPLRYTWIGKVVQWWKRNVAAVSAEPSLPDGTYFLHDSKTGASIGRFNEAYVIAAPMGAGSASTPGGH